MKWILLFVVYLPVMFIIWKLSPFSSDVEDPEKDTL